MKGDKFSCRNCNYKWTNKKDVDPKICPGCSGHSVINETEERKRFLEDEDIDVIDWEDE